VGKKKGSDTKNFQHNGSILKDRTLEHAKEFEKRIVTNIWLWGFTVGMSDDSRAGRLWFEFFSADADG
jgi:hypothetical protein